MIVLQQFIYNADGILFFVFGWDIVLWKMQVIFIYRQPKFSRYVFLYTSRIFSCLGDHVQNAVWICVIENNIEDGWDGVLMISKLYFWGFTQIGRQNPIPIWIVTGI